MKNLNLPVVIQQKEDVVIDEIEKLAKNDPFRPAILYPNYWTDIYKQNGCNTTIDCAGKNQFIDRYGDSFQLRCHYFNISIEIMAEQEVDLEEYFRKATRIWFVLMKTALYYPVGPLTGIISMPLFSSNDLIRKQVFGIWIYPYLDKDKEGKQWTVAELNEKHPFKGFCQEGEIGNYTFEDFERDQKNYYKKLRL